MSTTIAPVLTGTWNADKIHSSIGFTVKHMVVATFRGGFADYDASLTFGEEGTLLHGVVRVDSVEVKDENLKGHLQGPDFFDAEQTPEITFTSTDVNLADDGTATVSGDLTLKGHTEHVEASGDYSYIEADIAGGERIGLALETVVDRTAFGLNWNAPLPKGGFALANDVKLVIQLELTKEA